MTKSTWLKIARTTLIMVASLGLSFWLWAYLAQKEEAKVEAIEQAKWEAERNKRYPVKGRRTDLVEPPSLPSTGAPPLDTMDPGAKTERPRMRISRGEEE